MSKKIYVASSWRNKYYTELLAYLREVLGETISFYDFRNPVEGNTGFSWRDCEEGRGSFEDWIFEEYLEALEHPKARQGFAYDFNAMREADACVLVLPCGRSAHLEAGYFIGANKPLFIYIPEQIEPELMYKMTHYIYADKSSLAENIQKTMRGIPFQNKPLKTYNEIVKAHDIIASATNNDSPIRIAPRSLELALAAREVFCWMLGHPGGEGLNDRLKMIEQAFEDEGYTLEEETIH